MPQPSHPDPGEPIHIDLDIDITPASAPPHRRRAWIRWSASLLVLVAAVAFAVGHRPDPIVATGTATSIYVPPALSLRFTGRTRTNTNDSGNGMLNLEFINDSATVVTVTDPIVTVAAGVRLVGVALVIGPEPTAGPAGIWPSPPAGVIAPTLNYGWLLIHYAVICRTSEPPGPIVKGVAMTLSAGGRTTIISASPAPDPALAVVLPPGVAACP